MQVQKKKKDTVQAATSLLKQIETNGWSNVKTNWVYVDFRKAFDEVPTRTSVTEKFKDLKIRTVFEYHVYEILKFSPKQILKGFETLSIGTQNRETRNRSSNNWNLLTENDRLDSRAIILINALRK